MRGNPGARSSGGKQGGRLPSAKGRSVRYEGDRWAPVRQEVFDVPIQLVNVFIHAMASFTGSGNPHAHWGRTDPAGSFLNIDTTRCYSVCNGPAYR